MDQMVSLGSYKRAMCAEPDPDAFLPADDEAWGFRSVAGAIQATASTSFSEPQSPFGRLCQSSLLVSRMLRHRRAAESAITNGTRFDIDEVASLTDLSSTLCHALQNDFAADPLKFFSLVAARCVNFSATLQMLASYTQPDMYRGEDSPWLEEELALRMTAADGLKKTAGHVCGFAAEMYAFIALDDEVLKTPPVVLHSLYLAAVVFLEAWKETGDPVAETSLESLKKCLARLGGRWRLGKELLLILERHESNYMTGHNPERPDMSGIPLMISAIGI